MAEYRALGFDGDSPDDAADRAEAHRTGRTAEDVRRERLAAQEREQVLAKQQAELEFFRSQAVKQKMDADLKAIQKAYPEVKSLGELGDGFLSLIRAGVAAPLAARVVKEEQAGSQAKAPAKAGKVNAKSRSEKEFYTNEELDRLTPADLDDPKVMEKALRSLTKLG